MKLEILTEIGVRMPSCTNRILAGAGILTGKEVEAKTAIENARSNLAVMGNEFPKALESARQLRSSYKGRLDDYFTVQIEKLADKRKELMGYSHTAVY
jgi:hypothetical protein